MKRLLLLLLKGYKYFISPMLGNNCRYYPSCSDYAQEAIHVHGPFKGTRLALWRILRCNPFAKGGLDPVPPKKQPNSNEDSHD
ncbi:membrane protein insertion efficiency factor YidD [Salinibius halmophilus]|uniref:membrane protein insertion efficiency factor YidD n=1 Tax=Salinibius halmophilus TaxID=1853216 RepID=UPI001F1A8787|nr:membrane protein insertion efficiency factor YidD [Salinibius halmophilus]